MEPDTNRLRQQRKEREESVEKDHPREALGDDSSSTTRKRTYSEGVEGRDDPLEDFMLDIDGDDLLFSDGAFSSLPDFPCLSSPSTAASPSSATNPPKKASLTSSPSSSSSSWPLPDGGGGGGVGGEALMHAIVPYLGDAALILQPPSEPDQPIVDPEAMDILRDIDLLNLPEPWDPSSLFPGGDSVAAENDAVPLALGNQSHIPFMAGREGQGEGGGGTEDGNEEEEEEEERIAMGKVFLDWLKANKESITPEDLRRIKLKTSTIDCAARRLGHNLGGRMQLLKLILAWVQDHHLIPKRRRCREQPERVPPPPPPPPPPLPYDHLTHAQQQQFAPPQHLSGLSDIPILPNPSPDGYSYDPDPSLALRYNPWIPCPIDPTTGAPIAAAMMGTYGGGSGDTVCHGAAASYAYHHPSYGMGSVIVNSQPFSPSPDFHAVDHSSAAAGWPPQYTPASAPYTPFPVPSTPQPMPPLQYPGGGFARQYPGHPPSYHQGQSLTGLASATKEARKKRMARQRRYHSLHQHRSQHHHHGHSAGGPVEPGSRPPDEGISGSTNASPGNWAFWSSLTSKSPATEAPQRPSSSSSVQQPPTPPPSTPRLQQQQQQQQIQIVPHISKPSPSERRLQVCKVEKNLKFLLQKVLKQSDVGGLGRIVLPKKEAEMHLPDLDSRDGISIPMEDIGTSRLWNLRYRFWPNNKSRMYLLENTGDFVRSNGLQEGDFIVIYSDVKSGKYKIRGVKIRQPPDVIGASSKNAGKARRRKSGGGSVMQITSDHDESDTDDNSLHNGKSSSAEGG